MDCKGQLRSGWKTNVRPDKIFRTLQLYQRLKAQYRPEVSAQLPGVVLAAACPSNLAVSDKVMRASIVSFRLFRRGQILCRSDLSNGAFTINP